MKVIIGSDQSKRCILSVLSAVWQKRKIFVLCQDKECLQVCLCMYCSLQLLHASFPVLRFAVIPHIFEYIYAILPSFTSANTLGQIAISLGRFSKVIQEL